MLKSNLYKIAGISLIALGIYLLLDYQNVYEGLFGFAASMTGGIFILIDILE